ncbi:hypothetical protein [Mesorhizobium delmotii]|uniref:Uncharacterized protein n=1 Tax=Mesorhizobium delmotii TaxID=1631247 RepID=A0A2P9ARR0_9HYPH|nr:hypothetical protein [Mesorhizobium delmotii]SJM33767.1 conserved hypothetical protein [Mesorhizobium delmotii]
MNTTLKLGGGVAAASAACCAVSVGPALLAGTSLGTIGAAAFAPEIWIVALAVPAAVGAYFLVRRKPASMPKTSFQTLMSSAQADGCGCGDSCNSAAAKEEAPIACTLDAGDFKERTAAIRDLARRSLRHAARTPLALTLSYGPEALEEVRGLVAQEQSCCAFLDFDLKHDEDAVLLTITAPEAAAEAADMLFGHFAPELAASGTKEIA